MTQRITVRNEAGPYDVGVKVMDKAQDDATAPHVVGESFTLKPGEAREVYIWKTRYVVVEELHDG